MNDGEIDVFADTSVSPEKTLENLEDLQVRIEGFVESLAADGVE
ncbi:hypothetical protein R6242_21400 [Iodobacter sp. CM08]|nr:hypothetical protein [Iodobacter sp. CM08]MDW5419133.1 hypothetical protein [Iodobacter sp. CM08]